MTNTEQIMYLKNASPTTRPLQLICIRHAESVRNKAKRGTTFYADEDARSLVNGAPDYLVPLTDEGVAQAERTGTYLRERFGAPDYIYHSGYLRTIQTVKGILAAFPPDEQAQMKVLMNQFIRERDPGYTYDMLTHEAHATFPWLQDHWNMFGGFFARPPGGESLSDVSQRVYTFLDMLFRDCPGKRVWTVLHGGSLRTMRFILEGWDYDQVLQWPKDQSPENCGITVYNFNPVEERLVLQEYNTVGWRG